MIPQTTRETVEAKPTDESNKLRARRANNVPSDEFRKRGRARTCSSQQQQQLARLRGGTRRIVADEITLRGDSRELKGNQEVASRFGKFVASFNGQRERKTSGEDGTRARERRDRVPAWLG